MSNVTFECPSCKQLLETPAEMANQVVQCPSCQTEIIVPESENESIAENEGTAEPELPAAVPVQECHECGGAMEDGSVLCLKCGYHTGLGKKIETEIS